MTTSTKRARRAAPVALVAPAPSPLERALHPDVLAWLQGRAASLHGGDLTAAAAKIIERAYLHAHPEHGPCSACNKRTHYSDASRRCRRCSS